MKLDNFMTVAVSFLEQNLAPGLTKEYGGFAQWCLGGSLALLSPTIKQRILNNADMLRSLGVMDEENNINISAFESFLNGAFSKTPELRLNPRELLNLRFDNPLVNKLIKGNMVFTKAEADEFISLLKGYNH
jgi:hypothetical protein